MRFREKEYDWFEQAIEDYAKELDRAGALPPTLPPENHSGKKEKAGPGVWKGDRYCG